MLVEMDTYRLLPSPGYIFSVNTLKSAPLKRLSDLWGKVTYLCDTCKTESFYSFDCPCYKDENGNKKVTLDKQKI
jgi:hypothetical protein